MYKKMFAAFYGFFCMPVFIGGGECLAIEQNSSQTDATSKQPKTTEVELTGTTAEVISAIKKLVPESASADSLAVTIQMTHVTKKVTEALSKLHNLQSLTFGGSGGTLETWVDHNAYDPLSAIVSLKRLHIISTGGPSAQPDIVADLSFLKGMSNIEVLAIHANVDLDGIGVIEGLTSLKSLAYHGKTAALENDAWARVVNKPSLEALDLTRVGTGFSPAIVFSGHSKIKLNKLALDRHLGEGEYWSDRDVQMIGRIKGLVSLHLPSVKPISNEQVSQLKGLTKLVDLTLCVSGNMNDLAVVTAAPNLRRLTIIASEFHAFDDLVGHPSLREIEILASIENEDLSMLAEVPALKSLRISGNIDKAALGSSLEGVAIHLAP